MNYQEISPSRRLAKYVKCYWLLEQLSAAERSPENVVPDGSLEIIFNLADPFRRYHRDGNIEVQARTIIAGQMRSYAAIEPSGRVKLFGVRFHHAGAYPFFRFSLSELTDRIEGVDLVWGKFGLALEECINEAETLEERIAVIENALFSLLVKNGKFDPVVEEAAKMIVEGDGLHSIGSVAEETGVGQRRLERKFNSKFGITPKFFSRVVRFQNLLKALRDGDKENLLGTALSFGYYDQAHLIHEFNEFAGQNPGSFFESELQFSRFFIKA
jgi:AraC-like DNA-binding protein